jgi:hypothetical protein
MLVIVGAYQKWEGQRGRGQLPTLSLHCFVTPQSSPPLQSSNQLDLVNLYSLIILSMEEIPGKGSEVEVMNKVSEGSCPPLWVLV